ncbi:PEGA domain-containing protein [Porphyromonas sp.]|uniref:PEGA domain-containing protein n=1 Tax=Porphyromonas sp. TaxID=1924944 RepID=UPI003AB5ACFB
MKKLLTTLTGLLLVVGFILSTSSCASTTIINSNPQGAKVYMNQSFVGTTPYTHTDTKIVGSTTSVKLTKEGYEDFNTVLSRNEQVDAGAIVGGVFALIPFLWAMGYNPVHTYELTPVGVGK